MRTIILGASLAFAMALLGTSGASAAPAGAGAIGSAAKTDSIVHQVPCAMRRYCNRRGCVTRRVCW